MQKTCWRGSVEGAAKGSVRLASALWIVLLLGSGIAIAQTERPAPPPPPVGPYRIAGIVINAKGGAPLGRATVQIQDSKDVQSTRTVTASDDGRFEFRVMAGKFGLQAAKHGFTTSYYNAHEVFSSAVVTGAGLDTEHLIFRLPPEAALGGKILDENSEPVRGAEVHLYREDRGSGVSRIVAADMTTTDDQGAYEVSPLAEGNYFVAVRATPWYAVHPVAGRDASTVDRSLDVAYAITYYGDVTQPDQATPIPVRAGDRLQADIHLAPLAALHLTFHAGEQQTQYPVIEAQALDGFEQVQGTRVQAISATEYQIDGLAPGQYRVRMADASGQLKEPAEMEIANGLNLDSVSARDVSTIRISAQMRDGSKLPEGLHVALRAAKGNGHFAWERLGPQGLVVLSDVVPGEYDVLASTSDRSLAVVGLASAEEQSPGKTLEVAAGASLEITAFVVGGKSTVAGVAKRAGKAVSGAMIVLVPESPDLNRELFRRDQSDLDGTFSLPNVIPANYTVIAIDDGWDLDWAKQAVLARYLTKGQHVKVDDKTQGTIHLSAPVEVQKK